MSMKKIYEQPEMTVIVFGKDIRTDSIITVSGELNHNTGTIEAGVGDRMGRDSWDAGY